MFRTYPNANPSPALEIQLAANISAASSNATRRSDMLAVDH
jgi:hypothetical protein